MARIPWLFRSKWFIALAVAALVLVGGCLTVRTLASPARLRRLVREGLEDALGGTVHVGEVSVGIFSGAVVRDVELRADGAAEPWASVHELHVVHSVPALLTGRVAIERVRVVGPRLVIDDATIARLEKLGEGPAGEGATPAVVTVEGATIELHPNKLLAIGAPLSIGPISLRLLNADRRGRLLDVVGEVVSEAGRVEVDAGIDTLLHSVRFRASSPELSLERIAKRWLPPSLLEHREVREISGRVAVKTSGWVLWGADRPKISYLANVRFDDVALSTDQIPVPLRALTGNAVVRQDMIALRNVSGRLAEARFSIRDARVALDGSGEVAVRGRVENAHIDKIVHDLLPADVRKACESLGPKGGIAQATFQVHAKKGGDPVIDATTEFQNLALSPPDVNFPIPPLSGAVRYNSTQKLVVVEQITGRNGVGSLDVRGTVSLAAKDPEYRMRVRLDGVRLDKQLEDALPKHLRGVWDAVGILGGSVDTDLAVAGRGDQPPRVTGTVDAEAVSLRPEAFPYSLPPLSGRIRLAPGYAIHLDRLSGSRDGLTVEGSGFIDASTKNVIPQLRVRGQDLPVDEQLISALPEAARDPVKAVGIAGGNVDVDFVLDAIDGKAAVTTEVTLHGCSLKARDAPYALEGLRGTVRWSDRSSAIEIHDVAGRHGQAGVTVNGRVDFTHPDKPEIDITLDATDVALDDSLFQALPEDVRKQLAPFALAGSVDIEARHVSSAKTNERTRLTVTLDGVDLNVTPKGPRLTDLAGAVQTDGRTLTLPFVRGRFATLPFETNGAIALQPTTTGATLRFRVPPTHLDASLVEHLPESFADIARRLGPRGMIALSGAVRSPEDSTDVHLSSATLSVSDVSLAVPPGIDALTGSATYVAGKNDEGKLAVKLGRVRIAGLSLRDLEASADLTQKGLDIHDMAWMFYDGRVTGKFRIGADKLTPWEGQIDISHVDVEDLAVALGATTDLPTGWLGGKIIFHGVGDDMSTVAVTGEGRLESGHLYNLPLIVSIWNLFSFANPGRGAVTDARLKFRLRDEVLHIDHFLLTGEAMPMAITGSIELKPGVAMGDQKMDIIITAARQKGLLDEIPVVNWIKAKSYNQIRKHILQARATGTFNNPKLSTVMDPLTKPISEFWSLLRRDTEEKKAKTTQDEDNIKIP